MNWTRVAVTVGLACDRFRLARADARHDRQRRTRAGAARCRARRV